MKTLKLTLVLSHTGIILLVTLVLGAFFFPMMSRQLEEREKNELQFLVEHGGSLVESYIQDQMSLLEHVADNPVVLGYLDNYRDLALAEYLASFQVSLPMISYVGPDGFEEVRVERGKLIESDYNYQSFPFFQQSRDRPNEVIVVQDPALHHHKEPAIILAHTKSNYFGDRFAGLLLTHIHLRQIAEMLLQLKIGEDGFMLLESQDGRILLISSQDNEVRFLGRDQFSAPQFLHNSGHELSFFARSEILDQDSFWTHVHLDEYQLNLWAVVSRAELTVGAETLQRSTLLLLILICVLALFGSFALAYKITTPLDKLTKAAQMIAQGKDQELISLKSQNEIGILVDSFNTMVTNLNQTTISRDYFNIIISSMRESLIVIDMEGKIQTVNEATTNLLGYDREELVGMLLTDILRKDKDKKQKFLETLSSGQEIKNKELIYIGHDGREIPVLFSGASMNDHGLVAQGVVCVAIDMTERNLVLDDLRQSRIQLQKLSITDDLTGLLNRRGFVTLAGQQLQVANRVKTNAFLLYMDVDGLKNVNDTLGHHQGDCLIKEVAELLRSTLRDADIISRLGGDEFAAFLVNSEDSDGISRRLNDKIAAINQEQGRSYTVSLSYGLAAYTADTPCNLEELMSRADGLMYEQKMQKKKQGEGRVVKS